MEGTSSNYFYETTNNSIIKPDKDPKTYRPMSLMNTIMKFLNKILVK
jgi:hypothetical protein